MLSVGLAEVLKRGSWRKTNIRITYRKLEALLYGNLKKTNIFLYLFVFQRIVLQPTLFPHPSSSTLIYPHPPSSILIKPSCAMPFPSQHCP
jgi:hypothetical protein